MDSIPPNAAPSGSLPAPLPGRERPVLVFEPGAPRPSPVVEALSRAGAVPLLVEDLPALLRIDAHRTCRAALVRVGKPAGPDADAWKIIRILKQRGFTIAAWEDGLSRWPIGHRCRPLVEGAAVALDGGLPSFPQELTRFLSRCLRDEAERHEERERAGALKRDLGLVGESPALTAALLETLRVSVLSDLPVLLTGETGTGKELLARGVHGLDPKRNGGPFVAVNCGALPPALAESELFGHRRGAFTGAERDRSGLVRAAGGGVLFLDEVGEMEAGLQTKLLRVLQENRVLAVGEDHEVPVDVRIIAATHQDLRKRVREGTFRADLFHRLNVLSIHLPPLRQRPEDLAPLTRHFAERYATLCRGAAPEVDPEVFEALAGLSLPGNVRQLENLIRQAMLRRAPDSPLTLRDLPPEVWEELSGPRTEAAVRPEGTDEPELARLWDLHDWKLSRSLQHFERLLLKAALLRTRGNQSETARLLGLTPRSIYNKLRKHGLLS